jgi:hypothetical protein
MDHFPFQHYIMLRDVINLRHTLSDALRQCFGHNIFGILSLNLMHPFKQIRYNDWVEQI